MKPLTRAAAIREHCIECCCGNKNEVRLCTAQKCALFPYRMGRINRGEEMDAENKFDAKTAEKAGFSDRRIDCGEKKNQPEDAATSTD